VLLRDQESWQKWHRPWAWRCGGLAVVALVCYVVEWASRGARPGGSSLTGLACGVIAGLLFLFLAAFAVRKSGPLRRAFDRRPTRWWLGLHIWAGLLTLPLVAFHTGLLLRWGGLLTTVLTAVYLGVFLSGVWGLLMQDRQPSGLLQDIPGETINSQVPALLEQSRREARLLVLATCGFPEGEQGQEAFRALAEDRDVVARAHAGKGTGLLRALPRSPLDGCEVLRRYFHDEIEPFLEGLPSRLRLREVLVNDFRDLRSRLPADAHPVARALEDLCERRRQLDRQARLHRWLHGWITVHLALSAGLLVLLGWHVATALWYW
jgi:hypothetical protein